MSSTPARISAESLWSIAAGIVVATITFFVLPSKLDADGGYTRVWIALVAGVACAALGIAMGIASRSSNGAPRE